jgi:two-component sensor histidine kinase
VKVSSIFRRLRRDRPWWGVVAGGALFALAAVLRTGLGGLTEGFGPMLLLPAILLAGLLGGIRVGLGAAAACSLVAWIWFFPPYGTFVLEPRNVATIVAFILTAALELCVIRVLNLAINDLSVAEERSATMFRELQHRIANNLQVASGVMRQQRKKLDPDSDAARALDEAQNRLDLMVRVHRGLNSPSAVDQPVGSYFQSLGDNLIKASDTPQVQLTVTAPPVRLDVERLMSLSMIVAEAVTNSLKYAFRDRSDGRIAIDLSSAGRNYTLTVRDDGPGFAETPPKPNRDGLGRGIIDSLVCQLHGRISFEGGAGATVRVVFPI